MPFWWESLLSLFTRDSSMHISCLQNCLCGGGARLQYSGVLPGRIVIKTILLIVFHAKPGWAALEMMSSQFWPYVRWTLRGSDCLLFWCWSVWRRQGLQAKDFSYACLQWKWKLGSVSAQDQDSRLLICVACFLNACITEGSAASQSWAASSLPGVPF